MVPPSERILLPDADLSNPDFQLWREEVIRGADWRLFQSAAEIVPMIDVEPLAAVLPKRGTIPGMAGTADVLERIQLTLAAAGLQEGFNRVYAAVSRRCHDVYVQNEIGQRYGPFHAPEALNRTGPIFVEYHLDAYRGYVWAVRMIQSGQMGPEAFRAVPPHWRPVYLDQDLKRRSQVAQFDPGMNGHIGGDLGFALLDSDPPAEYRVDFIDKVSQILYDVAYEHTPELVDGNHEIFRSITLPVIMATILKMRVDAWRDFRALQKMTEAEREEFALRKMEAVALNSRIRMAAGRVGLAAYRQTNRVPDRAVAAARPVLWLANKGLNGALQQMIAGQVPERLAS